MKKIIFDLKLENHNTKMLDANFWQDKLNSQKIIKEKKLFEDLINSYEQSKNQLKILMIYIN